MKALGMVEIQSIPVGIEACDAMLKAASVELVTAQVVCAGKYIAIVTGEVAAAQSSVQAAARAAGSMLINQMVIPRVHSQVPQAINACSEIGKPNAVGIMEMFSLVTAVVAADAAVKAADVNLIEVRLGRGMGGKSFVSLTGSVSAVRSAIEAGSGVTEAKGLMAGSVIIPSPHPDLLKTLL